MVLLLHEDFKTALEIENLTSIEGVYQIPQVKHTEHRDGSFRKWNLEMHICVS